ncbi:unannotated protein [freshwater metagenome]|uniref:Unannotated protein n=1 Tax=freshwater metagenome TaxID=449393 RepID=A0A6J6INH0_9ZZZZ
MGNLQVVDRSIGESGCEVKLARVTHIFTHRNGGEVKGSELGFYSLPTENALVITTTFIYSDSPGRELTHNQMGRGAA